MLADAFVVRGMNEEAHEFSHKAERLADPDDVDAQMRWRRARARVLVRRGDAENAEALARAAVGLVAHTDALNYHADALLDLAEVLRMSGREEQGRAIVTEAIALYERKENLAMVAKARRQL